MNLIIDISTLTIVSSVFYFILLIILLAFWRQNKDIDAILWWCGFPLFRLINSTIGSDAFSYENHIMIYISNFSIILSEVLLMIGCFKFAKIKIYKSVVFAFLIACISVFYIQYGGASGLSERTKSVVLFDIIPIFGSLYALSTLNNKYYLIEKFFTIFWIVIQIAIFIFWMALDFKFDNPSFGASVLVSLAFIYLGHIFVTLGLIILTIAHCRRELLFQSHKHSDLESKLRKVLQEAQIANDEKTKFLENMSYELRTPLNSILGYAESLKLGFYGKLNDNQKEYSENIYNGGQLLLKLITDLLDLSKIEEGKVEIIPENINLKMFIEKTIPLLNEIVSHHEEGLIVVNNLAKKYQETAVIYVDQIRTKQILINLVSNATKYSPEHAPVTFIIDDVNDKFIRLSIKDEGIGIEEDQYENIFKPFNRAGNDNSAVEGVGVGLSITKRLIEEMNGKIDFKSNEDIGTTFWIDIPKKYQRELPNT